MEIGDFTMPLHPPGTGFTDNIDHDLARMAVLDELGYREAWIGEHFTSRWESIPAPDLFIARALGMTENLILGTGVNCLPNHSPFTLAHRIAQLDHMAHGRFQWGVGPGGFPGDLEAAGFDPATGKHRQMTRESVDLILELWRDPKPGKYESEFWSFTVPEPWDDIGLGFHMQPYQKPHPPIAVAGSRPSSGTLKLAGERGWIPMSINFLPGSAVAAQWASVEEGARESGRTADRGEWRIARDVYVADTTAQARKDALEGPIGRAYRGYFLPILGRIPGRLDQLKVDPNMPDSDVTLEYLLDHIWVVGSPDEVAEKLNRLYEEVGGFGVLLTIGHEWKPWDRWRHSTELLVREVLPRLPSPS